MALPSQSGRPQSRHTHTFRRASSFGLRGGRSGRRKPLFVAGIALLTVTVTVWGYRALRSPADPDPTTIAMNDVRDEARRDEAPSETRFAAPSFAERSAPAAPQPEPEPERKEEPPKAAPPVVRLGERSPDPASTRPASPSNEQPAAPAPTEPERTTTAAPERNATPPLARDRQQLPAGGTRSRAMERVEAAMENIRSNRPVEARRSLTQVLDSGQLNRTEAARVRETLNELNDRLVFSPEIVSGDPFSYGYAIRPGDSLSRIASREGLNVDWRLVQRINRIRRPEQIRAGQHLKLIRGPFHAVVYKREFRMDVYLGEASDRVFVRSFPVGLGEYDSTPVGTFRVRANSKLINPEWVNPRTGERFRGDDPMNPIGDRWIGLEGVDEAVRDLAGYGIHGTIEPETIGTQASMGCVRMMPDDVELVYELLTEGRSIVEIRE